MTCRVGYSCGGCVCLTAPEVCEHVVDDGGVHDDDGRTVDESCDGN